VSVDEDLDVIDEKDHPTGKVVKYSVAHRENILHRVAAVLVFRPNNKLIVQAHKHHGRRLDHSVGGHVMAGESYEAAAKREMEEELGLKIPIKEVAVGVLSQEHYLEQNIKLTHFLGVFTAKVPNNWELAETEEVDQVLEMTIEEIVDDMNKDPDKFLQGFMASLGTYLSSIGSDLKIKAYGKTWGEL
jgi:isopentenyldiphosphate isomerase